MFKPINARTECRIDRGKPYTAYQVSIGNMNANLYSSKWLCRKIKFAQLKTVDLCDSYRYYYYYYFWPISTKPRASDIEDKKMLIAAMVWYSVRKVYYYYYYYY